MDLLDVNYLDLFVAVVSVVQWVVTISDTVHHVDDILQGLQHWVTFVALPKLPIEKNGEKLIFFRNRAAI